MPYRKGSVAEQAAKLRAKANRRIANLDKIVRNRKASATERQAAKEQRSILKKQVRQTYQKDRTTGKAIRGHNVETVQKAVRSIRDTIVAADIARGRNGAANMLMQKEINLASVGSPASKFSKLQVQVFYQATQRAWENTAGGYDYRNRNELIMRYYGTSDLQEVWDKVMELNEDVFEYLGADFESDEQLAARDGGDKDVPSRYVFAYMTELDKNALEADSPVNMLETDYS